MWDPKQLEGAPRNLFIICLCQLGMLMIGVLIGIHRPECMIRVVENTGEMIVDCEHCKASAGLDWRDFVLLFAGIAVIGVGIYAALHRDRDHCQTYGMVMLLYSFVIGLSAILTSLEIPIIDAAVSEIKDSNCYEEASQMMFSAREHAVTYALNCVLDFAGAVFAIRSKELFDYERITSSHEEYEKTTSHL
eukprot:c9835_g1_i1.p1 GENE.c9835_g1_i1~~c9835_g1_i1.p1  ORF type:complete len:204 (+),score=44.98 c9835_g1_i1:40-612(+)